MNCADPVGNDSGALAQEKFCVHIAPDAFGNVAADALFPEDSEGFVARACHPFTAACGVFQPALQGALGFGVEGAQQ